MELFLLEHKKLWRRMSTKICVSLCFIYVVIFGGVLSYQWFTFGSSAGYDTTFSKNFDGYEMIRNRQEYSYAFGGELTDETLQQLVRDYQRMAAANMDKELKKTDIYKVESWIDSLYPELINVDMDAYHLTIEYVEPEKLTGFYERRQGVIERFLEANGQTGAEREYLLHMNSRVKEPFRYEWSEGWQLVLASVVNDTGMVMALFLAITLSAMFAGEWHDNTNSLMLTTKNGWKETARAKICAGLVFALELFTLLMGSSVAVQIFFLGTTGWDMPIQNIKLIAVASMNMLQAEVYGYVFTLLGAIGYAGIVMLISAAVKNNFIALLFSLAVVYLPPFIAQYLPYSLQKALDLLPLVGSPEDVFRTNTFCIFGNYIWSPYLLITVPVMIGILCLPFAARRWAKRLKV